MSYHPETDNSPVYWEVQQPDGSWFSLHTYAWSVKSFGGRRFFGGAKRGEDVQLPHRRGRMYMPKTREAQTFDINMWVFPTNTDGTRDVTKTVEQKAHENWRRIIDAVDQEGQFRLRKRWYADDSVKENFTTDVQSAIAMAEFLDGSGPDSDDGKGFYVNLTFSLADPYFYGNQMVDGYEPLSKYLGAIELDANSTTEITLLGDVATDHILLGVTDPGGTDTKIIFPDGNWIQLLTSQSVYARAGEVTIDFQNGLALFTGASMYDYLEGDYTGTYLNGLIRRNPYFQKWPTLDPTKPTSNEITVVGDGTIRLIYDPAYR